MRIICSQRFIGLAECISVCNHEVILYNKNISIFDLFYKFQPELIIIEHKEIDDIVTRCLKKYPATRLVVHGNTYNRCDLSIDDKIETTHFFLPPACNILRYISPKQNNMFKCDVGYIGKNNKYIQQVCQLDLNIKCFGENLNNQYYCGFINQNIIGDLFYTAESILHVHEEESSQQIFDILYCEGNCLSDFTQTTSKLLNDRIMYINDLYLDTTLCLTNKKRSELLDNKNFIFSNHTYFDRCISLFKELNFSYDEFLNMKKEYKNKYYDYC